MNSNKVLLFKKILNKKTCFFCGAGISLNSGVPLVIDIKTKILKALPFDKSDFKFILEYSMPFELLMESLIENSSTMSLLDLFEIGSHSTNHLFIAKLVKEGYIKNIVTTNFDNFFETALEEVKVNYRSYYKESDFEKIDWEKDDVRLIKIHGSIHDKPNMAVTIKKVSSKELLYKRNKIIVDLLSNSKTDSIIFLGYSCSDIFDINPTIKNCQYKNKTIFYFQHNIAKQDDFYFTNIKDKEEPNPFVDFKGYLINGNTDQFVKSAWVQTLPIQYTQTNVDPVPWEHFIDKWIEESKKKRGEEVIYFIAGQLLITTTNYSKALNYFFKGLELSEAKNNFDLSVDFLYSIGRTYQGMQKLNDSLQNSIRYLYIGLKKSREHKLRMKECSILLSLGIAHEDKKDHDSAIKFYEDALKIAEQKNEQIIIAKCLGNLGIVFKNIAEINPNHNDNLLQKALKFQIKSLQISIEQGDKRSEGRTYGNIAVILSKQDKKVEAIKHSKKALQIAIELSDLYHQGIWKHNIGDDYIGNNNTEAEKYLLEAKEIFRTEGLDSFLKICEVTLNKLKKHKEN